MRSRSHSFPSFGERERKRREREKQAFSLSSMGLRPSEFVVPRVKVHLLDKGYMWVPIKEGFQRRSKRGDSGEIKVLGFRRGSRDLLPIRLHFKR